MSVKPCSSNSEHSHSADSTRASGVALPYLASSRLSSEPALTPILIGMPAAAAARAISPTLSSNALMLPGFTRTAAQPASIAANTYLGWKWMSAITGICDLRAISGSASASSWDGTATRTIWQPAAVSSAICCRVRVHVGGQRRGHRLHRDRRAAADRHRVLALAHHDLAGRPPRRQRLGRHGRQAKINSHNGIVASLDQVNRVEDVRGHE